MTRLIKPRTLKIDGEKIYLIADLLEIIIEKFNHGEIDRYCSSNSFEFYFWATDKEYKEIIEVIESTGFDIEVTKSEEIQKGINYQKGDKK